MKLKTILKDAGEFQLLTTPEELKLQLHRIERAGRTCYQSNNAKPITDESAEKFVRVILKRGHESVIEHSIMTVQFNNVSRGFTHEQVRHRLTAISQESTRYVDYAKEGEGVDLDKFQLHCVVPPHRDENKRVDIEDSRYLSTDFSLALMYNEIEKWYRALRKAGWPPEDARQILPIGLRSQIVITANFREWRHMFKMRTDKAAHWEIRGVYVKLLDRLKETIPVLFEDFEYFGSEKDKNGLRYYSYCPGIYQHIDSDPDD